MQAPAPRIEATRLYSDPNARELLRRMLTENVLLEPVIGGDGRVHYLLAEEVLGLEVDVKGWIGEMVEQAILRKASSRQVIMCPAHMRADPMVMVECLKCRSKTSVKRSLVEHTYCGYIGDDSRFDKNGTLQCPNCGRPIRAQNELRVSGVWYECQNCLSKTSTPRLVFVCKEGNHEFSTADLALVAIDAYSVNEKALVELRNTLLLDPELAAMLTGMGYEVSAPAKVQGQSGSVHSLDVYAKKDGETVALQVAVDTKPVDPSAVIAFFAKAFDIKPNRAVLVTIPAASEDAKRLETGYGVSLVEDFDGSGVVRKVKEVLEAATRSA
ncbi:MAG: hypothetical protein JRN71_06850 [Nitrososphaerota archaeon]|nr:hypothetical protein [Nitrososphaerota archaeon]MDG6957846.1 hypothetical protein [Nitrososphaerota archaeon]MDG6960532.1 hypothetical protein [Nitrososphaerota archaeon]MDG6980735.1 hypothetical protein [Nitrososphaerota archaeon]MDG6987465.1 hypothetical protein [Nitrososphaerota archaeon]